jgi:hypothetical protein
MVTGERSDGVANEAVLEGGLHHILQGYVHACISFQHSPRIEQE